MNGGTTQGVNTKFKYQLCAIALSGLLLRLMYVLFVTSGTPLTGDAQYYHDAGNLLADGLGFTEPYRYFHGGQQEYLFVEDPSLITPSANTALPVGHIEPTAGHPPLWVLVLGLASLLGATSVLGHQLVSCLFGMSGILLIGLLGRRIGGERTGLLSAGFAAGYAFLWLNDGSLMSETLVTVLVTTSILSVLRLWKTPNLRNQLIFGGLIGLLALTRAELLLFLPVAVAPLLIDKHTLVSNRLKQAGTVICASLLIIAPWVIRNLITFEEPVILSNGAGVLLAQTNCDATYYGEKVGYWEHLCVLPQPLGTNGETLDESQRDSVWRERGINYASDNLGHLITHVVPRRVGRLWGIYQPIGQIRSDALVEGRNINASKIGLAQFAFLLPAAAIGAWLLFRQRRHLILIALMTWPILATFVAAATMGTTRYRVSAEVTIVILAALTVDTFITSRNRHATTSSFQTS